MFWQEKETWVIAGLGNPGLQYVHTRHNTGYDVVELISEEMGIPLGKIRCKGRVGEKTIDGRRLVLCEPQTYMNLSGDCIGPLLHWYKSTPEQLLVICDDVDLRQGAIRFRKSGSPGTHNGLRHITAVLGENFARCRVGVGSPSDGEDLANWVLSKPYTREGQDAARTACETAAEGAMEWFRQGIDRAMARYNRR